MSETPRPSGRRHAAELSRRQGRRRLVAVATIAAISFLGGVLTGAGSDPESEAETQAPPEPASLPRGGTSLLPEHRLVAFYGAPQSEELGILGIGSPEEAAKRLEEQARPYGRDRPVLPVLELLATIAASDPGDDGLYRLRQPHRVIRRYLATAREHRALLVLDIQPGASDFPTELARLRRYLREPDVGLALDPEWHVGPGEVPGQVIGSVDAQVVNGISARLAEIVERHRLPEKLLIVHQFTPGMIARRELLRDQPGVEIVLNSDGFGDRANKVAKYRELRPPRGSGFGAGFKLFYREDIGLMEPADVLSLRPRPDLVVYE